MDGMVQFTNADILMEVRKSEMLATSNYGDCFSWLACESSSNSFNLFQYRESMADVSEYNMLFVQKRYLVKSDEKLRIVRIGP